MIAFAIHLAVAIHLVVAIHLTELLSSDAVCNTFSGVVYVYYMRSIHTHVRSV